MAFTTKKSLLARVQQGDEISWREFYEKYKPLIWLCGKDCSLTDSEIEELIQQVMTEIFRKDIIGKYDPEHVPDDIVFKYDPAKGRFRHYLRKIIRNHAVKIYHARMPVSETGSVPEYPDGVGDAGAWEKIWDEEWKKHVLTMALTELRTRVRAETFLAFEMYAIQNKPVEDVAQFLDLSVASVYTAKSRCIATLKDIIKTLEEQ